MIAKLKTAFIFCLFLGFSIQLNAKESNWYQKITTEYHIHPYNLEYGYPIIHHWDQKPIRGIIFLSNEVEYLEKLDSRTYVGQPTLENAKIIANFSAEPVDFPKYYLVVDSTVSHKDMSLFLAELIRDEYMMDICFVGGTGRYVPVQYDDWSQFGCISMPAVCINARNVFQVMLSSRDELLVENNWIEIDSVYLEMFNYYYANINLSDMNVNTVNFQVFDTQAFNYELENIENGLVKDPGNVYYEIEKEGLLKLKPLIAEFGSIKVPNKQSFIQIRTRLGRSLKAWYQVLDQLQLGIHLARYKYAEKSLGLNYLDLFSAKNKLSLDLLEYTFPDRIKVMFQDEYPPPPPPLEYEAEIVPEPQLLEPDFIDEIEIIPDFNEELEPISADSIKVEMTQDSL